MAIAAGTVDELNTMDMDTGAPKAPPVPTDSTAGASSASSSTPPPNPAAYDPSNPTPYTAPEPPKAPEVPKSPTTPDDQSKPNLAFGGGTKGVIGTVATLADSILKGAIKGRAQAQQQQIQKVTGMINAADMGWKLSNNEAVRLAQQPDIRPILTKMFSDPKYKPTDDELKTIQPYLKAKNNAVNMGTIKLKLQSNLLLGGQGQDTGKKGKSKKDDDSPQGQVRAKLQALLGISAQTLGGQVDAQVQAMYSQQSQQTSAANPYKKEMNDLVQAGFTPDQAKQAVEAKMGMTPKDTTEQERFVTNYKKDHPGSSDEQALRAYTDATTKETAKGAAPLEAGGVMYAVRGADGKEYYPADMNKPDTPSDVKQIFANVTAAQKTKQEEANKKSQEEQRRFEQSQAATESRFERTQAQLGTWAVAEGGKGETVLYNSKTGETKEAPTGLHKSGYYTKNIAPLEAASLNIGSYMDNGVFDGPGDLALQHEFFTATQPATGFRMTKVQQDMLENSRNWLSSAEAKWRHATTGTWYSDEQRKQIADAAQSAMAAKKQVLEQSAGNTQEQTAPKAPNPRAPKMKFNVAKWKAANPGKDVNAAIKKAQSQNYEIVGQ